MLCTDTSKFNKFFLFFCGYYYFTFVFYFFENILISKYPVLELEKKDNWKKISYFKIAQLRLIFSEEYEIKNKCLYLKNIVANTVITLPFFLLCKLLRSSLLFSVLLSVIHVLVILSSSFLVKLLLPALAVVDQRRLIFFFFFNNIILYFFLIFFLF